MANGRRIQMKKIGEWFYRFMQGRYLGADTLNRFLIIAALIVDLIGSIARIPWLVLISEIMILYALFRCLSKNIVKRTNENRWFREKTMILRRFFKMLGLNVKDHKNKYMLCPKCHTILRVPRGHGKVEITCRSCGNTFKTKS